MEWDTENGNWPLMPFFCHLLGKSMYCILIPLLFLVYINGIEKQSSVEYNIRIASYTIVV